MKLIALVVVLSLIFSFGFCQEKETTGIENYSSQERMKKQNDEYIIGDWTLYKLIERCSYNCDENGKTVTTVTFPITPEWYHRYIFNPDSTYKYIIINGKTTSSGHWGFIDGKKYINIEPFENMPGTVDEYQIGKITKDTLEISFFIQESTITKTYIRTQ